MFHFLENTKINMKDSSTQKCNYFIS